MLRQVVVLVAASLAGPAFAQTTGLADLPINCAIRPLRVVEVAAPFGGVIDEVFVRPGQQIAIGDPIASFDSDLARAALEVADTRAGMTAGRDAAIRQRDALIQRVERLRLGVSRRVVSMADFEAAQLELANTQGLIDRETEALRLADIEARQARLMLDKSVITSPVAGQVGEDLIDAGESPGSNPIAVIFVNQPLRVEAFVPTIALAGFVSRDTFEIVVNGNRDAPVAVTVDYISQVADLSSNAQSVYFTLDAPNILPGYQCLFLPPE